MRFTQSLCAAGFLFLLLLVAGCAKSPDTLMQEEQEAFKGAIAKALDTGQSVILCRAPRRTAWVRQGSFGEGENNTIVLRPEMPTIDGYSALVVQPGTYVLAGAGIVTDGKEDRRISQTSAPAGQNTAEPFLGYVQKNRTVHQTVTTTKVHGESFDQGMDYSLGLGLGRGYGSYGSRGYYGGYGRRGYHSGWGPRSWFGTSVHYSPSSYYRPVYTVEERKNHVQDVFTLTLPNGGMAPSGSEPLVASFSIAAGEVLVLDIIYLSALSGDFSSTPGEAKANAPDKTTSHASSIAFTFESFADRNRTPPDFGRPVVTDRRLVRGLWLTAASPVKVQGRGKSIVREILPAVAGSAEVYAQGQREKIRLSVE